MVLNDNLLFGSFNGAFNGNGGSSANAEIEDNVMFGDFNGSANGNCDIPRPARASAVIENNSIQGEFNAFGNGNGADNRQR